MGLHWLHFIIANVRRKAGSMNRKRVFVVISSLDSYCGKRVLLRAVKMGKMGEKLR